MANLNKLLKQAQKMQAQVMRAQEDLKTKQVEGTAGGGMVTVTMNGGQELVSIKINPQAVDPNDVEMLEDLVLAAFKNAQEKIQEMSSQTFGSLTSGMNIPGLG
jgi:DNA-binding YbaB/EbfC family protein